MSRTGFLDKTLLAAADVAEQSLFSEKYAQRRGLLQSIDVRVKIITVFFLLVVISLVRAPASLWLLYGVSLALAAFSRVPLWFFMKRVWLFVPLFSAAIALPALLNIITPGDPLMVIVKLNKPFVWGPYSIPQEIAITRQGLWGGVVFVSRVAASVSFAVLFTLTTKWAEIFAGLRSLHVPRIFVLTLSMTYRYLFIFLRMIQEMYRGRKSRTIRPFSPAAERGWIASRIWVTFKKSVEMGNDIYMAMLSRGYRGEAAALERLHASLRDYIWLTATVAVGGIILLIEKEITK